MKSIPLGEALALQSAGMYMRLTVLMDKAGYRDWDVDEFTGDILVGERRLGIVHDVLEMTPEEIKAKIERQV